MKKESKNSAQRRPPCRRVSDEFRIAQRKASVSVTHRTTLSKTPPPPRNCRQCSVFAVPRGKSPSPAAFPPAVIDFLCKCVYTYCRFPRKEIIVSITAKMSGEQRRAAILKAVRKVFVEKGFHATTTRELADAAGVSEALIFKHFPNKEALYLAIQMSCFKEEGSKVIERLESLEPSTTALVFLVHDLISHVLGGSVGRGRTDVLPSDSSQSHGRGRVHPAGHSRRAIPFRFGRSRNASRRRKPRATWSRGPSGPTWELGSSINWFRGSCSIRCPPSP